MCESSEWPIMTCKVPKKHGQAANHAKRKSSREKLNTQELTELNRSKSPLAHDLHNITTSLRPVHCLHVGLNYSPASQVFSREKGRLKKILWGLAPEHERDKVPLLFWTQRDCSGSQAPPWAKKHSDGFTMTNTDQWPMSARHAANWRDGLPFEYQWEWREQDFQRGQLWKEISPAAIPHKTAIKCQNRYNLQSYVHIISYSKHTHTHTSYGQQWPCIQIVNEPNNSRSNVFAPRGGYAVTLSCNLERT